SLVVVSNLKRAGGVAGMHAAAASGWLSGAEPKHTEGQDYRIGTTIDQVLAGHIGQASQFPSIEFATEDYTGYVGGCTPGYSCAYQNTISWATATTPLPMEINPRSAFERLFGDGGSDESRRRIAREDRSILDSIAGEARRMQRQLAAQDRTRVADPWHVVSHHGDQAEKVARAAKINVLCVGMFAKFIEKLRNTPDGDGTLLDHSLMFYGSGMGNSNVHATDPLPMLAMGGGVGK